MRRKRRVGVLRDPVCGTAVKESGSKAVYKNKAYYFCCASCQWAFERGPERFVKS